MRALLTGHVIFKLWTKNWKSLLKEDNFTKNLLFGRSTDWWLRNPPPLDISFPPLSLNMNSLKQILEDVKIEGGSEKRENCLLGARLVSNPYVTSQKRIKRVSTLESQLKKSSVAFHNQLWKNIVLTQDIKA